MGQDLVKNSPTSLDSVEHLLDLSGDVEDIANSYPMAPQDVRMSEKPGGYRTGAEHEELVSQSSSGRTIDTLSRTLQDNSTFHDKSILCCRPSLQRESLSFMKGVMDECTHMANFSVPVDPSLIIVVQAKEDAYIPRTGVLSLKEIWPGCEVRYLDGGHISAYLFKQHQFRHAIYDAFERFLQKYSKLQ